MQHFPIFLDLKSQLIIVSGGGEVALAKLRLLSKTEAQIKVFALHPSPELRQAAAAGQIALHLRVLAKGDATSAKLVYCANEDADEDARVAEIARAEGALVNIVDDLHGSDFITPAIVDRSPVTIAIGTEGAAPVLARAIKADLEERLPSAIGLLARVGKRFRSKAAQLSPGRPSRDFWSEYYFKAGPGLVAGSPNEASAEQALERLLERHLQRKPREGHVAFVGAGPGDPDLLTIKARKELHEADVVIHDHGLSPEILELCRREAIIRAVERNTPTAVGCDANLIKYALEGAQVIRLKHGDPSEAEETTRVIAALESRGIDWSIIPGISVASGTVAGGSVFPALGGLGAEPLRRSA
jgi:uroporphyrin-III C-methyltransferase/precorrin-2 dehydrogenase/sirohydrochlorin ferrochelatase